MGLDVTSLGNGVISDAHADRSWPLFRALLWKEWRESRRQFFGCILLFLVLPAVVGTLYDSLIGESNSAVMLITFLGVVVSAPLAAVWGAHAVCRDLSTYRGRFLLARPIADRIVLIIKALMASFQFTLLAIFHVCAITVFTSIFAPDFGGKFEVVVLVFFGLLTALAFSFLVAVFFRRLVPSILCGFASTVFLVLVPMSWLEYCSNRDWEAVYVVVCVVAHMTATGMLLGIACLWGWPADRAAVSNRSIGWSAVALILASTAFISNLVATDTTVVAEISSSSHELLGSKDGETYWLGHPGVGRGSLPTINRSKFDDQEGAIQTKTTQLIGFDQSSGRHVHYQTHDSRTLLVIISDSLNMPIEMFRFDLNFDVPESSGERIATLDGFDRFGWVLQDGNLYHSEFHTPSAGRLCCYEPTGGRPRLRSQTQSVPMTWARTDIIDGTLVLTTNHFGREPVTLQQFQVDTSDPDNVRLSNASKALDLSGRAQFGWYNPSGDLAFQHDNLAISFEDEVRLYHRDDDGSWSELGRRRSTLLELMAGRNSTVWLDHGEDFVWQGNHVFEISSFGLIVYGVSIPHHPRRIAHVGGAIKGVAAIDSRHIVVSTEEKLEVHRLPD